jgi:hypothetical protein
MQVGDLVKYRSHDTNAALGIVLRTPEQTNNGDFEVCFLKAGYDPHTMYCRGDFIEAVSASR